MLRKIISINIIILILSVTCIPLDQTKASTSKDSVPIDIVFCLDLTASMWDDIDEVCDSTTSVIESIKELTSDFRIGFIGYRDIDYDSVPFERFLFSSDATEIQANINMLPDMVSGGGDIPESVYEGLYLTLNMPWRADVARAIILMGDAPPKTNTSYYRCRANSTNELYDEITEEEIKELKETKIDIDTIVSLNTEKSSHIYPIVIASNFGYYDEKTISTFDDIANRTEGKRFVAENAEKVPEVVKLAITEAVDNADEDSEDKVEPKPSMTIWLIIGAAVIIITLIAVIITVTRKRSTDNNEVDLKSPRCSYCGRSTQFVQEYQQCYCGYCDIYTSETSNYNRYEERAILTTSQHLIKPTTNNFYASQIPDLGPGPRHEHKQHIYEQQEIEDWSRFSKKQKSHEKSQTRKNSKSCPECGSPTKGFKFCPECGEKLLL